MFLIAGLGNPGKQYGLNRHNIGFLCLDYLVGRHCPGSFKKKDNYEYVKCNLHGREAVLLKPLTYMNLSGSAVVNGLNFFKVPVANVLVIYDDTALPFGMIRIKESGSPGGHNGLKHIQQLLGTQEYKRIRLGIGAPEHASELKSYVLHDFPLEQLSHLENDVFKKTDAALAMIMENKILEAMNIFNEKIRTLL